MNAMIPMALVSMLAASIELPGQDRDCRQYLAFDLVCGQESVADGDTVVVDCVVRNVSSDSVDLRPELRLYCDPFETLQPLERTTDEELVRVATAASPVAMGKVVHVADLAGSEPDDELVLDPEESVRLRCRVAVADLDAGPPPAELTLEAEVVLLGPESNGAMVPVGRCVLWIR